MIYGSLQQDEVVIDFDDDLDIIEFPKDGEGDIENQIKPVKSPGVETNNEIIHHEPQHNALASNALASNALASNALASNARASNADVNEFNLNYTHYIARSSNRNYKPLVMTICSNIELTVPQMVILFIMCIFLEYFVLLLITR